MPESRHAQIVRQWKVLLLLDAHQLGLTFLQLRQRLNAGVTERTLRRDIDALTLAGFPIDVRTRRGEGDTLIVLDRTNWKGADVVFAAPARTH